MSDLEEFDMLSKTSVQSEQDFTMELLCNPAKKKNVTFKDLDNAFKINESLYTDAIDLLLNPDHPERKNLYTVVGIMRSYNYPREYFRVLAYNLSKEMTTPYNVLIRYLDEHQLGTVVGCYGEVLCRELYDDYDGLEKYFGRLRYLEKVQGAVRSATYYLSKVKSVHYETAYKEAFDLCVRAAVSSYFPEYFTEEELNSIPTAMSYYCKKNTYKTNKAILARYNLGIERAREERAEYREAMQEKLIKDYTNYLFQDEERRQPSWDVKTYYIQERVWYEGIPHKSKESKVQQIIEEVRNL